MSIEVKSINDIGIKEKLRGSECPICRDALELIKAHERIREIEKHTKKKMIKKIREQASRIKSHEEPE